MERLALALVLLASLQSSLALADEPEGAPSGVSAASRHGGSDAAGGESTAPMILADRSVLTPLELVVIVAAHAEIGLLYGGNNGGSLSTASGVYGPTGHLRAFIGHDVLREGELRIAVGYEGSVGVGYDAITAARREEVVLTRHAAGVLATGGGAYCTITLGAAVMHAPNINATLVGATAQGMLGGSFDGFWIGMPVSVDYWPEVGMYGVALGLALGWTTL